MSAGQTGAAFFIGGIVETQNCWSSGLGWRLTIIRTSLLLHTWAPRGSERLVGDLPGVISWQRQGTLSQYWKFKIRSIFPTCNLLSLASFTSLMNGNHLNILVESLSYLNLLRYAFFFYYHHFFGFPDDLGN